jgi:hypothetical protein
MPNDPIAVAYGILAATSLVLALIAWKPVLILAGAAMCVSWWCSNSIVAAYGLAGYIRTVPEIDTALAIVLAWALRLHRNPWALAVVLLFIAEDTVHATFVHILDHAKLAYVVLVNAIFASQCLTIIGGARVSVSMAGRAARSHGLAHPLGWICRRPY